MKNKNKKFDGEYVSNSNIDDADYADEYPDNDECENVHIHTHCHDETCDCGHHHGNRPCVLYDDRDHCIDCGECEMCDLDPTKKCDNCGKCLEEYELPVDEKGFYNFEAKLDMGNMDLEDLYKAYGLDDEDDDTED